MHEPMTMTQRPFASTLRRALSTPRGLLLGLLALPLLAQAQVTVNEVRFPTNLGRTLTGTVEIDFARTASGAATIVTAIPSELTVNGATLPAGCALIGPPTAVECVVPGGAGTSGTLSFPITGSTLGAFNLTAIATGGSSASNTGIVRSSGDLSLTKAKSPAGNVVPGQNTPFTLTLGLGGGADDLPAGASITIVDNLPGTATDYSIASIASGIASCSDVATANASRTLTCTVTGPRTTAELNGLAIVLTGAPGSTGTFSNTGTVQADANGQYFDRNPLNNNAHVDYTVVPGGDVQAQGSFPTLPVATGSSQSLNLGLHNNSSTTMPAGGTVSTQIPAGFTITSLPPGCTSTATVGVLLAATATVTCTTSAPLPATTTAPFAIGLTMPAAASGGNFPVTVTPASGFTDSNPANNTASVPWQVVPPFADLVIGKSKNPGSGPIAPNSTITTVLSVGNHAASTHPAVYSGQGGGTELRVVDYLRPTEIAGDVISNVVDSGQWACSVSNATDPTDATRTKRVECVRINGGSLTPGAALSVSFQTTVAAVVGQVALPNRACTGETVLSERGLSPAAGPQPPGRGAGITTGNDCVVVASDLIATDVITGGAAIGIVKESSIDGSTWVDNPATPPTLAPEAALQHWRITITTPSGGSQQTIPTLNLADPLPGILNVASPGAPVPAYVTPNVSANVTVSTGAVGSSNCPAATAGSPTLNCQFTAVQPGTTIVVTYTVARPFSSGLLTNTAALNSPNAILSGTLSDAAALNVAPRVDVVATTKTVSPITPRIGQNVLFTVTAQNYGPDDVSAAGEFKIFDDINTSLAGGNVAFADISVSAAQMNCTLANSALADEPPLAAGHVRARCLNADPVPRYWVRTMQISARVLKPAAMPGAGNVYSGQTNTARVELADSRCEFKTETGSNASLSSACNDAASTSNNTRSATFDVQVPQVDLQQRKERVLPVGQTSFGVGQPLRYRFRLQNNGASRAEGVRMVDRLTVPAGFTLHTPTVLNVNGVAADSGYALDTSKTGSVSCSQAGPNADLICTLAATPVASYLDELREVNFEIELQQTGNAMSTVTFGNQALVCGDESAAYESAGACDRSVANNNNLAAVNDVVFPNTDLALQKTTVTPSPVGINQPVEYRLQARNLGPSAIQQIRVGDTLPANFELITTGAQAPSVVLGAGVTAAPSTVSSAALSCTAVPPVLTAPGQQQVVSCVLNALPGPFGSGAFPGNAAAGNVITLRLFARPKEGFFSGPYLSDVSNNADISPGRDAGGNNLSVDPVPGNNNASSVVQVANSSLAGRVFVDRNGNGAQDGTLPAQDEGIGNVTLTLSGTDLYGNAVSRTLTTVNTVGTTRGDYLFDNLPPGSYSVTETQPTGYVNSAGTPAAPTAGGSYTALASATSSSWTAVTLPINTAASGYLFPESAPLTGISGVVFNDRGDNGALDAGDPGLGGVTLVLGPAGYVCPVGAPPYAGSLETVVTDTNGQYHFASATPGGSYVVCQIQPAGHADRTPLPGVSGSTPAANRIEISNLPASGSPNNNFPEVLARISGRVFLDYNAAAPGDSNNGVPNAGEPGIGSATPGAGVPITLTGTPTAGPGAGVPITRTVYTAADGSYAFNELLPGSYTVTEGAIPAALGSFVDGRNTAGPVSAGGPGAAGGVGDNSIRNITLNAGARSPDNNFAELLAGVGPVIGGVVFVDRNRDGLYDGGDVGRIGGVTVRLVDGSSCSGPEIGRTQTLEDGSYRFPGGSVPAAALVAGRSYSICEDQPSAWGDGPTLPGAGNASPARNHIVLPSLPSAGSTDNNFGELGGRIAGQVFLDFDNNGQRDGADFGIEGVVVRLQGPLGTVVSVNTRADGSFAFEDLPAGSWTLLEQPAQPVVTLDGMPYTTLDGRTTPGTGGGSAAPVGNPPSRIGGITLTPGGEAVNNLFAETLPAGVGLTPQLRVGKTAQEARFIVGRQGHYGIQVRNVGPAATDGSAYTVSDRLPAGLTLASLPSGNGWTCTAAIGGSTFSCSRSDVLAAGASAPPISFAVNVATAAANASPVHNAVLVEGGGEPAERRPGTDLRNQYDNDPAALPLCVQPVAHDACRATTPVVVPAALSGTVWLETGGADRQFGPGDRGLGGWIVELVDPVTGQVVATTTSGPDGRYRITDIEPGVPWGVRFRDPDSGVVRSGPVNGDHGTPIAPCAASTPPSSCGSGVRETMITVVLAPGQELVEQSLPVDPSGVVYDAVTRDPVPGAVVGFTPVGSCPGWDPATAIAGATLGGYVINGSTISMTTGANGYYSFVLLPGAPARCTFAITVTPPSAYSFVSTLIPPQAGSLVPSSGPGTVVAVQPQPQPPSAAPGSGTTYYLQVEVGSATAEIVHNHIPLDPAAPSNVMLRKVGDKAVAELGDSVRYSITVSIGAGASPRQVTVVDRLPAGFTFIAGTAMVDGQRIADPAGAPGPRLAFQLGGIASGGSVTLQYRVRVGVGAQQGDGVNSAIAYGCQTAAGCTLPPGLEPRPDASASNEGRYRVRVTGGVFSLEACVLGKVYVDCNGNHVQDREELGIPGVRLVLQDGTFLTSDSEGKYSACGLPPRSHVLRIDESTLPRGSRLTTSSNRNLGDAGSLWLDLKNGEIQRADFIEGSCANPVLDQVKARRAQGEVSAPQVEKRGRPALRFDSKAHGQTTLSAPTQGTDSANQQVPKTRPASSGGGAANDERYTPTPELPMNRPPPAGRRSSDAPDAPASTDNAEGSRHGTR